MDGQQQDSPAEVNGFARGVVMAFAITVVAACLAIGGCQAVKADAVNPAESTRTKADIPRWVVKPCATEDSVNCRYVSTNPGGHSFIVRQVPGRAHMVCVFYVEPAYARSHDYCQRTR